MFRLVSRNYQVEAPTSVRRRGTKSVVCLCHARNLCRK